jgi:hypothetical protein
MTHRRNTCLTLTTAVTSSILAAAVLTGCEPPPPPPPPPVVKVAPPPPPAPTVVSIKDLMAEYDIDPRVNLPEEKAPGTTEQRVAVLKFFDAFARGNSEALKPMLSGPDQLRLDGMVDGGIFKKTTEAITRIDVRCGRQDGGDCALAVFHVAEEFEPQLWVYTAGDRPEFDAVATPPRIMEKLSGDNWIAAWYEVLKLELAKADEPDVVIELVQSDYSTEDDSNSTASSAPTPAGPSAPGGMPGKRKPSGPPIKAPKAPGFGTK